MSYIGRLVAIGFILVFEVIWFYHNQILYNRTIEPYLLLFSSFLLLPAWWIGKQFDEVSFYKKEIEKQNGDLIHEVRGREERYKSIVEQSPNFIVIYDDNGIITYVNQKAIKLLDAKSDSELIGKSIFEFIEKSHHVDGQKRMEKALNKEVQDPMEYKIITLTGRVVHIESVVIHINDKRKPAIMVVGLDISKRKETEMLKHLNDKSYRALIEALPVGIIVHRNRKILLVNSAARKVSGLNNENSLIGKTIFDLLEESKREIIENRLQMIENGENVPPYEFIIEQPDGSSNYVEISGIQTTFQGEEVILSFAVDITESKQHIKKINELAYYDTLTSLPNRNLLLERLKKTIASTIVRKQSSYVLFLDLDLFKNINDMYGHSSGDELLINVAERITSLPSLQGQFVSRYGGDEFLIILDNGKNIKEVASIADQIIFSLKRPFFINDIPMYISTSIGISSFPRDGRDVDTIIKSADMAMYMAKDEGRNKYKFYSNEYYELNRRWIELERELRRALEDNHFTLQYQPKVNLKTGKIFGAEALLRWNHPQLGNISPAEFIPIAEETGLIITIGNWVLKEAFKQTKKWVDEGWDEVKIAVNVSVMQLQQPRFLQELRDLLSQADLHGTHLVLEITESLIRDKNSLKILHRIKKMGIEIAMDDFGTGYSSLSILKHVPIDCLKIDKSFIDDIHTKDEAIVKTIIDMGFNLNCKLVAEGIETKKQMEFLQQLNCHFGQGYYFSKPVDAEEILPLLNKDFSKK
jgi:diguanylate cyclase (GGDEF)-like protein/PAS domain S-box-containing protein